MLFWLSLRFNIFICLLTISIPYFLKLPFHVFCWHVFSLRVFGFSRSLWDICILWILFLCHFLMLFDCKIFKQIQKWKKYSISEMWYILQIFSFHFSFIDFFLDLIYFCVCDKTLILYLISFFFSFSLCYVWSLQCIIGSGIVLVCDIRFL